jgi:hypothetical protein
MKKSLLVLTSALLIAGAANSQYYTPIGVSGFNLDAIAEGMPASGTTTGSLDGSDYVLYTASYATEYMSGTGLPNNGSMVSGYKSYTMGNYTQNNVLYVPGLMGDSLGLNTPGSYASISLLGMGTEGTATVNVILKFTDGTSATYNSLDMADWFDGGSTLFSGFDRVGRLTGSVDNSSGAPYLYGLEVHLSCADQAKQLQRIIVVNTSNNARACVFAVSGAAPTTYTVTENDITCHGYTNGSAIVTRSGGLPSFSYSWNTTPVQHTSTASGLSAGTYTCTVTDGTGCTSTHTATITEPAAQSITLVASAQTVCPGAAVTLTANGAVSYTWSATGSGASIEVNPTANTTYTVTGTMADNCMVQQTVSVSVFSTPALVFEPVHDTMCVDWSNMALIATPAGGTFSGQGVSGMFFNPSTAGLGSHAVTYAYTDANSCTSTSVKAIVVEDCSTNGLTAPTLESIVYPNPATTQLFVQYPGMQPDDALTLYNVAGQQLQTQQLTSAETAISLEEMQTGVYLYVIRNQSGRTVSRGRFLKQ